MTDLELAKRNLAGHTICLCKDGRLLTSDKRGISPMMDFIEEDCDVAGYSVADKIVGKAAAFLFVLARVREVYARFCLPRERGAWTKTVFRVRSLL